MANARARLLRKAMDPAGGQALDSPAHLRSEGYHFRRQVPLLGYVVDFARFKAKLIVELDGSQHNSKTTRPGMRCATRDSAPEA